MDGALSRPNAWPPLNGSGLSFWLGIEIITNGKEHGHFAKTYILCQNQIILHY